MPSLGKYLIQVNSSKASLEFVLTSFDALATDEPTLSNSMILHAKTIKPER